MIPCNHCHRHLRPRETRCLFCGAEQRATPPQLPWGALVFAAAVLGTTGCGGDRRLSADDEAGTTTTADTSTDTSGSTLTDTGIDTNEQSTASGSFYGIPGDFGNVVECDPFLQDCPEGEKCVPYASAGGALDAHRCVPVLGDGQPGEPCTSMGLPATDDCDELSVCLFLDDMNQGECVALCGGVLDAPLCPEGSSCYAGPSGAPNLCLAPCDPLMDDCPAGQTCTWAAGNHSLFACYADGEDAAPGEPCTTLDSCGPASVCVAAEYLPACAGESCCAELCSLADAMPDLACSLPGTECVYFYEEGMAPPGYEQLGVCIEPPP